MKFIKFHPEGFSSCIVKLDEVSEILDEDCQAGDKIISPGEDFRVGVAVASCGKDKVKNSFEHYIINRADKER